MLSRIYQASDARMAPARQRARITAPVRGVPVYVMLPLDTVWLLERDGTTQPLLIREKAMEVGLEMLSRAGVDGVMIDVWWGIAEHAGPGRYDFSAYRKLFEQVASKGLKVQAVMSFHAGALPRRWRAGLAAAALALGLLLELPVAAAAAYLLELSLLLGVPAAPACCSAARAASCCPSPLLARRLLPADPSSPALAIPCSRQQRRRLLPHQPAALGAGGGGGRPRHLLHRQQRLPQPRVLVHWRRRAAGAGGAHAHPGAGARGGSPGQQWLVAAQLAAPAQLARAAAG